MIWNVEDFTTEDEVVWKCIEALNRLSSSSFIYSLKTQIGDQKGLNDKISDKDQMMHRSLFVDDILVHVWALQVYGVGMGLTSFKVFVTIIQTLLGPQWMPFGMAIDAFEVMMSFSNTCK